MKIIEKNYEKFAKSELLNVEIDLYIEYLNGGCDGFYYRNGFRVYYADAEHCKFNDDGILNYFEGEDVTKEILEELRKLLKTRLEMPYPSEMKINTMYCLKLLTE